MQIETNHLGPKALRNFGLVFGTILVALFGLLFPWVFERAWPYWPWIVAAVFWAAALLYPAILGPVYRVWMKFGSVLGWVNTRLILGIMFYLVFLPVGLILKILGKDAMRRRQDVSAESYRIEREAPDKDHVERPY